MTLDKLLEKLNSDDEMPLPSGMISRRGDLLVCGGDLPAARANNIAVEMMEKGKFEEAALELEKALLRAPLFVPFRYNLGVAYSYLRDFKKANLNFDKAIYQVPQYYIFYIQKGLVCEMEFRDDEALEWYKKAARLNRMEVEPLVVIGNLYFSRGQHSMAEKYYTAALKLSPTYANAIIGMAKIYFSRENLYLCYMTLKKVDLKNQNFDKSYYFYYAESAYRLRRYRESYESYTELLKHGSDRFFVKTSVRLIEHKADLAKRFAESIDEAK